MRERPASAAVWSSDSDTHLSREREATEKENWQQVATSKLGQNVAAASEVRARRRPLGDAANIPRIDGQVQQKKHYVHRTPRGRRAREKSPETGRKATPTSRTSWGLATQPSPGAAEVAFYEPLSQFASDASWRHLDAQLASPDVVALDARLLDHDDGIPEPEIVPNAISVPETDPLFYEPLVSFAEQDIDLDPSREHRLVHGMLCSLSPSGLPREKTPLLMPFDEEPFPEEDHLPVTEKAHLSPGRSGSGLARLEPPILRFPP